MSRHDRHIEAANQAIAFGSGLLAARLGLVGYRPALCALRELVSARSAMLVRSNGRRQTDILATTSETFEETLELRAAANALMGAEFAARLHPWAKPSPTGQFWVVPLGHSTAERHAIILTVSDADDLRDIKEIGQQAAQSWNTANAGTRTTLPPAADGQDTGGIDLLGPDNPFGLTKAERGVCLKLQAGTRPAAIAAELGTSISTVRTHLRRIYSKTDCGGMVEVMHLLGPARNADVQEMTHVG